MRCKEKNENFENITMVDLRIIKMCNCCFYLWRRYTPRKASHVLNSMSRNCFLNEGRNKVQN